MVDGASELLVLMSFLFSELAIKLEWTIPFAGLMAILASGCIYLTRMRPCRPFERVETLLWALPSVTVLAAETVICFQDGYISSKRYLLLSVLLAVCSGCSVLFREKAKSALAGLNDRLPYAFGVLGDAVILLAVVVISFFLIEMPWNDQLGNIAPHFFWISFLILSVLHLIAYFVTGRRGFGPSFLVGIFLAVGLAQYFVGMFKGSAIVPSDVFAVGTALSVSAGYDYVFGAEQFITLGLAAVAISLLAFVHPAVIRETTARVRFRRLAACFGTGLLLSLGLGAFLSHVSFSDDLGYSRGYWDALSVYKQQGFIGSFISLVQNAQIQTPDGYSEEEAREVLSRRVSQYQGEFGQSESRVLAENQFNDLKPTVIVVMNESFSDLSIYNGLNSDYSGPVRFKGVGDALYTGYAYASVMGGGTCNSEFEFLTSACMGFLGTQNEPYMMHDLSSVSSLPRQFEQLGYTTTAIHPNVAANWNRGTVYPELGFEEFLDIVAFDETALFRHSGVSDQGTYNKILEQLHAGDSPQFIFDVTMQNHSGYEAWDLTDDDRVDCDLSWLNDQFADQSLALGDQVSEYISLIETSDRDFSSFLDKLRVVDRPVVVVFFGDHQPWFGSTLSSLQLDGYEQDDPAVFEQSYATPYMIWANYDVAGNDQVSQRRDLGISSLSALLNYAIGAPMSDWQKAQIDIMREIPIINGFGYKTIDGTWHVLNDDVEINAAVRELEWIQYLEYASKI